jgi:glyoxylase-like metal-dependent hydrolase (beta-lactamase superfamily II)
MPTRVSFSPLTRRDFLKIALAVPALSRLEAPSAQHGTDPRWGIPSTVSANPRKFIEEYVFPLPKPRQLDDQLYVSSGLENVFYISLGGRAVLLDSGFDHQADHHLDNFEKMGCDLKRVVAILASHSHVDHTGGLKRARTRLGVPVLAHPHALAPITQGDLYRTAAVVPEVEGWKFDYPACPIDETVDDGDVIEVGDERIQVYHIPGHTPDCNGYLWRGRFFTGDVLWEGGLLGWSSARWFSNLSDMAETMRRLVEKPVPATRFYPTHGPDRPYRVEVPKASLAVALEGVTRADDPCNHTPRIARRAPGSPTRILRL